MKEDILEQALSEWLEAVTKWSEACKELMKDLK